MSDLICGKSMTRCQTPGMCSPHGGCQPESISDGQHIDLGKFIDHVWAIKTERDQLKAENEALLKALDVAAARMLAAKVCFDRDYPGEWSGELHLAVAIKEIDAAMGKGEQS